MTFPYISQIKVNNCFTYKNFMIPNRELNCFKHIILTGENGSGKTTILNRINSVLTLLQFDKNKAQRISELKRTIDANQNHSARKAWEEELSELNDIDLLHLGDSLSYFKQNPESFIFSFFKAHRKVELKEVKTVTQESEFISNLKKQNTTNDFINLFKQYLVNKKVYEAFNFMNSKEGEIKQSKIFFDNLTETLRSIFKDEKLELEFVQENFEFYLNLKDSRKITFNQLSEGFSAFLSILMDLFMRTDLLRKTKRDYSLDPKGIILIDEPETHFHLSMQYEILPLITRLFPKIQLIVATHSPAIISSIKEALIYDLTSKEEVSDWVLGSSFSELMIKHFGLDNEYSSTASGIIHDIKIAVNEKNNESLEKILNKNQIYLTPSLRLEIESQIIDIKNQQLT